MGIGLAVTFVAWMVARKIQAKSLMWLLLLSPFMAIAMQLIHNEIVVFLNSHKFSWQSAEFDLKRYTLLNYLWSLFYFTWLLGYFTITNHFKLLRESLALAEAQAQFNHSQLAMLRYQINPHFLFNSLNSISSLILQEETEKAEDMIGNLSRFLRFSLDNDERIKVPLREEIDIIKEYLAIEKIRFADRMEVDYFIDGEAMDCLVPSLILQPAIENAIKYVIAPGKKRRKISIRAARTASRLEFEIFDNGPGFPEPKTDRLGIGLKNISERIHTIYGSTGTFTCNNLAHGGARVSISFPCEREDGKE